jgi:SAM-dependent methyltransferase
MYMKSIITKLKNRIISIFGGGFSSRDYWANRYESGGNSGPGSYGDLAKFKASTLNEFVRSKGITSVIEFGSGDGNQLTLAEYPRYVGYDVSSVAVKTCKELFKSDATKKFFLASKYDGRRADLTMSLDVIFHLTEDRVFEEYMHRLFDASTRFVIIYSSNQDEPIEPVSTHVRHRRFTTWVEQHISPQWVLVEKIANAHPYSGDYTSTSFSDFYIHEYVEHSEKPETTIAYDVNGTAR